jgi:signal transduction histidine kinase/DNA-binding response OmpR family regulator
MIGDVIPVEKNVPQPVPDDKANILIVDDLPDKLLVLETVLAGLGQNLVTARSGEEALRRVLEQDFAVILLDIKMPGMDGLETAAYIRRRKKSVHTPIIFITAYGDDEARTARGYSLGAVDYIFSPVVPEVLRTKVKVFVDLYLMAQQVRRQADERVALAHEQAARAAAEQATRRFAFLAEAGAALSRTLDFGATLRALARHAVPDLADLAAVSRVDEHGRPGATEVAWQGAAVETRTLTVGQWEEEFVPLAGTARRCLESGVPLHLADLGPPAGAHGLRSVLALPLVARGRALGVLTLALGPSGRVHGPDELVLADDLAARAATALDNARLYEDIRQEDARKNQFLMMLAHELRNPLAPIRNAVGVLKLLGARDSMLIQARDMIDRQVTHMARLVDDLLDMSRLARGKILLRRERLDLARLVRDTIEDYRSLLADGSLHLVTRLPEQPVPVEGDATRLSQVIGNVLHNASKFTDAGGSVEIELRADPGEGAVLAVRDTGIGMDRAMLDRVFEAFSQADSSLDRSRGGLGLGLALVRGLVRLHAGEARADSEGPGRGTQVTIRLPLLKDEGGRMKDEPSKDTVHPSSFLLHPLKGRVLVIEDNPDAAESMRMLFNLTGHEVAIAHAGPAGLEAARAFRPQVVLCDIGLPGGMDGYAVARAIRGDPDLAAVRLVALSGYGQEEDRRRSREAGFDAHLIKPVDFADLRRVLSTNGPVRDDLFACDR